VISIQNYLCNSKLYCRKFSFYSGCDDRILGGSGADTIKGNNGKDMLSGNSEDDILGVGNDIDVCDNSEPNDTLVDCEIFN
jgi:Ca2+-binding RTX toxin-like protein